MHYICNVITFVRHFIKRQSLILEMAWRHIRWYQLILQLVKNYQIMPFSLKRFYLKRSCLFAQENTIRNRMIWDSLYLNLRGKVVTLCNPPHRVHYRPDFSDKFF